MPSISQSSTTTTSLDLDAVSQAVLHLLQSAQALRESTVLNGRFPESESGTKAECERLVGLACRINAALPMGLRHDPAAF